MNIFGERQELHPDLVPYRQRSSMGFEMIHHPLVISLMHVDDMNSHINSMYTKKMEYIKKALDEKDWAQYLFMHERPYRFDAFSDISRKMNDREYWELLGQLWVDSENLWQTLAVEMISSNRGERQYLMSDVERAFLNSLPDVVRIYRGHQFCNEDGLSWTLSPSIAKWFAERFANGEDYEVIQADIPRSEIFAVFVERGEVEVVAQPENWESYDDDDIPEEFADFYCPPKFPKSLHGVDHWHRVERNAILLANLTPDADVLVARLFAWIHDSQRIVDHDDHEHGLRAAKFVRDNASKLKQIGLSDVRVDLLATACKDHESGFVSNDPTIGVCWDADRLDLPRVGVMPIKALLSTSAAKAIPWLNP